MTRAALLSSVIVAVIAIDARSAQPEASLAFLRTVLGFSAGELRELGRGGPVVRSLDTVDGREVAIAGVVRVAVTPAQYITALRDIAEFKRHEAVVQIGTFSAAPSAADVGGLTLDRDHIDDLRECRLHDCDIQLSRSAIERVRAIQWSAPDAATRANEFMRTLLAEQTLRYQREGDAALMTYENERKPLSVAQEFRAMMSAPPAVLPRFPTLERHITRYPGGRVSGIDDLFYWSKEDIGPKVIISVTHMAFAPVAEGPVVYAVASKQLYGSHYFDSSLGLTLLLQDNEPGSTVLVYVNRSRVDALDGFLGGLKRAIVRSRARAGMEDSLQRIRTRLPDRIRASQQ